MSSNVLHSYNLEIADDSQIIKSYFLDKFNNKQFIDYPLYNNIDIKILSKNRDKIGVISNKHNIIILIGDIKSITNYGGGPSFVTEFNLIRNGNFYKIKW